MVRALLDTCVLSELQRPNGNPSVRTQVEALADEQLFLSVITIGELTKGIALLSSGERKQQLSAWLAGLEHRYGSQILPIDIEVVHLWGEITARAQTQGIQIPASDGLIAATALRHGLEVMTRNSRHFAATGAVIIDPWSINHESNKSR
jgi:predicted nucleic acid-binding protein